MEFIFEIILSLFVFMFLGNKFLIKFMCASNLYSIARLDTKVSK